MKDKKVIFFSYDFPPLEGGISRLCDEIVKQFIKNDWDVTALSVKRDDYKGYKNNIYPIQTVVNYRGVREVHSLWKLLKYSRDTLIITGVWYPEALLATLLGYKNIIVLAHGNDVMSGKNTMKNKVLSKLRKWVLNKAKLVICNSHYTQNIVTTQFPKVNTSVCLLGVDENRFSPISNNINIKKQLNLPLDKKIILTVSRIDKYKAHDVVLRALSLLSEEEQFKVCYCITGRGSYMQELKELAIELNVEKCIHWYGFIEEENLANIYRASDLFVLCTREEKEQKSVEGFGLVFLEAQACGIPVIGTDQGGIPDAVAHENGGWIIQRDDANKLAEYLKKLVDEDELFKEEGFKARKRVENEATWEHFGKRVLENIETLKETHE